MRSRTGTIRRRALGLAGSAGLALLAVASSPEPAAAHGVGGIRPTNYQTVVLTLRPAVAGVTVQSADLGDRLEVANSTARDVVVLGYDGEPYLRVGRRGAFENLRSPATFLNRSRRGGTTVPARADPSARPVWHRIGDDPVARWHDHRAHWMGRGDPPAVRADPDHAHVVARFRIALRQGTTRLTARGVVRWVPAPSVLPWLLLALGLAAGIVLGATTRSARAVVAGALVAVVAVEIVHVVGGWGATTLGTGARLGASVYAIGAAAVALVALVWVWRRGLDAAAPLVLLAGLFVAIAGGLADLSLLTRSQLPTTLPDDGARAAVATALGIGIGLAVVGAWRLRRAPVGERGAQARS